MVVYNEVSGERLSISGLTGALDSLPLGDIIIMD
jgi:hypothetical protein